MYVSILRHTQNYFWMGLGWTKFEPNLPGHSLDWSQHQKKLQSTAVPLFQNQVYAFCSLCPERLWRRGDVCMLWWCSLQNFVVCNPSSYAIAPNYRFSFWTKIISICIILIIQQSYTNIPIIYFHYLLIFCFFHKSVSSTFLPRWPFMNLGGSKQLYNIHTVLVDSLTEKSQFWWHQLKHLSQAVDRPLFQGEDWYGAPIHLNASTDPPLPIISHGKQKGGGSGKKKWVVGQNVGRVGTGTSADKRGSIWHTSINARRSWARHTEQYLFWNMYGKSR